MTAIHGKDTAVLIDEFDVTAYFNSAETSSSTDTAETTSFGASTKSYIIGMSEGSFDLSGLFDDTSTTGSAAVIEGILTAAATPVVTVHQNGNAIGEQSQIMRARASSYSITSPISDVSSLSASFTASADSDTNQALPLATNARQLTTFSSVSVSAMPIVNASYRNVVQAATSLGGMAALHVTANTGNGTNYTVKVQHSADNSSWADLVAFTAFDDAVKASEFKTMAAGTVNQYLRSSIITTGGTSGAITFAVSFARF